jgi:hypothetical protein
MDYIEGYLGPYKLSHGWVLRYYELAAVVPRG